MFGRSLLLLVLLCCQTVQAGDTPDTLADIKQSRSIDIAHPGNAPPFSFLKDGEPAGYSIDLCKEVVDSIAGQLGVEAIEINWREASTPEGLRLVADGVVDMDCGITTITLGRQERVDFSNEIFVAAGGVLVLDNSGIKGLVSLADKTVAVIRGTTTEQRLARALERKHITTKLVPVRNSDDGMKAVSTGKADAYAADRMVLVALVTESEEPERYAMLTEMFSIDPYAFVLPRGDADFRLAVNRALSDVYRGVALDQIFERWFGPTAQPSELLRTVYVINAYQD
ncbi:MAG: amino acid ABC transporter substrate-binding protein [Gammaproteobacteria bacterium]|jgi:ABC-type amino acid transport substrate-binding protein